MTQVRLTGGGSHSDSHRFNEQVQLAGGDDGPWCGLWVLATYSRLSMHTKPRRMNRA